MRVKVRDGVGVRVGLGGARVGVRGSPAQGGEVQLAALPAGLDDRLQLVRHRVGVG